MIELFIYFLLINIYITLQTRLVRRPLPTRLSSLAHEHCVRHGSPPARLRRWHHRRWRWLREDGGQERRPLALRLVRRFSRLGLGLGLGLDLARCPHRGSCRLRCQRRHQVLHASPQLLVAAVVVVVVGGGGGAAAARLVRCRRSSSRSRSGSRRHFLLLPKVLVLQPPPLQGRLRLRARGPRRCLGRSGR